MRKLLASALLVILALGFGPASAESTTVCTDSAPNICVELYQEEGDYSATFGYVWIEGDGVIVEALAGTESYAPDERAAGACTWREIDTAGDGACVVLFQDGDDLYLFVISTDAQVCYIVTDEAIHEC